MILPCYSSVSKIKFERDPMSDSIFFDLPPSWANVLRQELQKPYLGKLAAFLEQERWKNHIVFPQEHEVFQALQLTPFENVNVVIVGQDPYHGPGQAHGLCFSVQPTVAIPPSLQNIYKEMQSDLGIVPAKHGCLTSWAHQGVLLLNATLTVRQGEPLSHHKKGWEEFTDAIIEAVATQKKHVVFILWGKNAQEKCQKLSAALHAHHLVLTAAHPSPYSAPHGFFGCKHFSKANQYLSEHGLKPIHWEIPELRSND
jgi:uracil-DNA glycosylase